MHEDLPQQKPEIPDRNTLSVIGVFDSDAPATAAEQALEHRSRMTPICSGGNHVRLRMILVRMPGEFPSRTARADVPKTGAGSDVGKPLRGAQRLTSNI